MQPNLQVQRRTDFIPDWTISCRCAGKSPNPPPPLFLPVPPNLTFWWLVVVHALSAAYRELSQHSRSHLMLPLIIIHEPVSDGNCNGDVHGAYYSTPCIYPWPDLPAEPVLSRKVEKFSFDFGSWVFMYPGKLEARKAEIVRIVQDFQRRLSLSGSYIAGMTQLRCYLCDHFLL